MERSRKGNGDAEPASAQRATQGAFAADSRAGAIANSINNSPRMVAQRRMLESLFGLPVDDSRSLDHAAEATGATVAQARGRQETGPDPIARTVVQRARKFVKDLTKTTLHQKLYWITWKTIDTDDIGGGDTFAAEPSFSQRMMNREALVRDINDTLTVTDPGSGTHDDGTWVYVMSQNKTYGQVNLVFWVKRDKLEYDA